MGAKTFEEWRDKELFEVWPCLSYEAKRVVKRGYFAGQATVPPPGRWVRCSERLPATAGKYLFGNNREREWCPFEPNSALVKRNYTHWYEYEIPKDFPPVVDRDEDAKWIAGMADSICSIYKGNLHTILKETMEVTLAHARKEKGKQ